MRIFIVFALTKLFLLDVVCGYMLYKVIETKREEKETRCLAYKNKEELEKLREKTNLIEVDVEMARKEIRKEEEFCAFSIGNRHTWKKIDEKHLFGVCGVVSAYRYKCEDCGKVKTTDSPMMEEVK